MTIKIDKGIPMPTRSTEKYPFEKMEVGDSFFVPGLGIRSVSTRVEDESRKSGRKFKSRSVEGGVRVWRIK